MSIYTDKVYDQLDFISQATEPFMDNIENLFSAIPDMILLSPEDLYDSSYISRSYAGMTIRNVISKKIKSVSENIIASDKSRYDTDLCDMFSEKAFFTIESEDLMPVEINIFTGECSSPLYLVKKKNCIDNEDVLKYAKSRAFSSYRHVYFDYNKRDSKPESINRIKELCDIFNAQFSRTKNIAVIANELSNHILTNIENDVYRIRTFKLMCLIGRWCKSYVNYGDIESYTNLTRFKLMTHSGKAIYSVGEAE